MKTRIIIDSTTDLMPEHKNYAVTIPLTVRFDDHEYADGVTIDHKTFYEKLVESDVLPTTSQATPNDFIGEYEKIKENGESAVVITLSSKFSGTYQSAVIAAEDYDNIHVLGKARGSKMGNNLLVQEIEKAGGADFERPVLLGYSGLSDALLLKYIEDSKHLWEEELKNIRYTGIGSVIGTHAGPGAIAVAFFRK